MIAEDVATAFVEPLLGLPFAPANEQLIRRMVLMFRERCLDQAHAHRALDLLMERCDKCPTPMLVSEAISSTFERPEEVIQALWVDGETVPAWACLLCKDTGLYSRDVTRRNGDVIGVCGPCECVRGRQRAEAYDAREREKALALAKKGDKRGLQRLGTISGGFEE